jgi:hypothetical protein
MAAVEKALASQGFQLEDDIVISGDGTGLKHLLQAGQCWLEVHVNVVNGLNVFPVPDGDTGTNMVLTIRSAMASVAEAPDDNVATIAVAAAQGALMGARGNSGVILSQFLRGLASSLAGHTVFTVGDFARAAQVGVEEAYKSVVKPVEGTILTVARAAAEAAHQTAAANEDLINLLTEVVAAAKIAQAETPELLPVLKEAGVTDSGGQGLVYILEGGLRFLLGEPVDLDPAGEAAPLLQSALGADEEAYGYDVQFLIQGEHLDVGTIRQQIDNLGWSTVVVGDERLVKVHVHSRDPGVPISYGASQGIISDVVVENMETQAKEFVHDHLAAAGDPVGEIATIAVAPGPGLAQIFKSLGVNRILPGGQTMNPSIQELLEAIDRVKAEQVLVLPNNSNVILAARQAETLSKKQVVVVPTKTLPQGIAALLAFNYQADLETNARRMQAAAAQVQTIEVARAVTDRTFNGFNIKPGDVMGLFNDELMSVGQDCDGPVLDILARIQMEAYEIATIYFGDDCSRSQADGLAREISGRYPDLEIEVHSGGQPHYDYIISLE